MDSKLIVVSAAFFAVAHLVGCQSLQGATMSQDADLNNSDNQLYWERSGERFYMPDEEAYNASLKANESRVIFFRPVDEKLPTVTADSIKIAIGEDKAFHASLQEGHFSETILCSGLQTIDTAVLDAKNNRMTSYSKNYQLQPQTTTYLQLSVSKDNRPTIQKLSADKVLPLLKQSARQTHQISRVSAYCDDSDADQHLLAEPKDTAVAEPMSPSEVKIKNLDQLKILFDFDSTNIKHNNEAVLTGMVNFIQSYPNNNIILEGHTDNRGSKKYNQQLSQSRADAVKDVLVNQYGINSTRLRAIGYGEAYPIDTNDTKQGRQNNRRVVATINDRNN